MFSFSSTEHSSSQSSSLETPSCFLSAREGIFRKELPPLVLHDFDIYVDEVLEICKAHDVKGPEELGQAHPLPSLKTLERVQVLMDKIFYIASTKELPPVEVPWDDQDYAFPLPPKARDMGVTDLHGKFAVSFNKGDFLSVANSFMKEKTFIFNEEGEEIGDPDGYQFLSSILNINGVPGFVDRVSGKYIFHFGNKIIGNPNGYEYGTLCGVGGKPVVIAAQDSDMMAEIIHENKIIKAISSYHFIRTDHMSDVEGRLSYFTQNEQGNMVLVLDEKIVGNLEGYEEIIFEEFHTDQRRSSGVTMIRKAKPSDATGIGSRDKRWYILNYKGEIVGDPAGYKSCFNYRSDSPCPYVVLTDDGKEWYIKKNGTLLERKPNAMDEEMPFSVKVLSTHPGEKRYSIRYNTEDSCSTDNRDIIFSPPKYPEIPILSMHKKPVFAARSNVDCFILRGESHSSQQPFKYILGPFKTIYTLHALDDHRFYVIAQEQKKGGQRVIVKKVVDIDIFDALNKSDSTVL